ncbi:MAG: 4Fe-4S dicluster domain-containing protein [Syntrophobacteraceae bacterium]
MRYLNMYDSISCLNCLACMSACSVENRMRMERDSGVHIERGVNEYLAGSYYLRPWRREVGEPPNTRLLVAFEHCRHCENAQCLNNCPAKAIERRPAGQVVINESACIGCRTCRDVCPFDIPIYDDQTGKAKKCIGCYDRVESGMQPACISACPTKALVSGPEDEVLAEGERRIATYSKRLGRDYFLYGKDPVNRVVGRLGWVTIAAKEDAEHYDLFADPAKAIMTARDGLKSLGAVGAVGVVAGAALHGLYVFAKRKNHVKEAEQQTREASDE